MKLDDSSGYALIVDVREIMIVSYKRHKQGYKFVIEDGTLLETTDYEERLDFYHYPSDDGETFYDIVHVIAKAPDRSTLSKMLPVVFPEQQAYDTALKVLMPLVEHFIKQQLYSDDLTFARNIVLHVPAFYSQYSGNVEEAQVKALRKIFDGV